MTIPANLDYRSTSFNVPTNNFTVYRDNLNLISQCWRCCCYWPPGCGSGRAEPRDALHNGAIHISAQLSSSARVHGAVFFPQPFSCLLL